MNTLKYQAPATFWEEALPLGNGRIGAMIYGGVERERIELNEDTLWSGRPGHETGYQVAEKIDEVRTLIRDGQYAAATRLTDDMVGPHDSQSYQMAGNLYLDFGADGASDAYERGLDLGSAISGVCYKQAGVTHRRESFVSVPHQVMALRLTADAAAAISCSLSMDSQLRHAGRTGDQALVLTGQCPRHNQSRSPDAIVWEQDGEGGTRYVVKAQIVNTGGTVQAGDGALLVEKADEILLIIAIETGFVSFHEAPSDDVLAMEQACDDTLARAAAAGWDALKATHVAAHRELYDRVTLDLHATDERPTNEILETCTVPEENPALVNLVFNYGRYLLISSSRPGTQPANLQGIWNDKLVAPWRCNYTTNINLEMNYWPAESCNLAECAEPMLRFVQDVAVAGQRPARELYSARGWCLHHNSDLWRYTYTGGAHAQHAFWPVGGAWVCQHLWEHYAFSGDPVFLAEALPLMKEAAAFLLDFMVQNGEGKLTTSPSTSPENRFLDPGTGAPASVCEGSAMDLTMIRELFGNIIEGSALLGETDPLIEEVKAAMAQLAMPVIGKDGRLLEFSIEAEEPEPSHRHVSHLYGVYPGWMFTPNHHPEFYDACRKSLAARGDKSTGWAMGWRVALWARLGDGNRALRVIGALLSYVHADREMNYTNGGGLYANLWDAHPPFQIDGNFGVTAGIAELLLQSHEIEDGRRVIHVLPALPDAWGDGSVSGLRARGGVEVDLCWSGSKVATITLKATRDTQLLLKYGTETKPFSLTAGQVATL